MAAKLSDVAKEAGCSVTTVSRVINNHGYLSQKTKDKVFAAMRKLNYQPNSLARSLQGKKMKLIGLIFPGITNPFFAELVQDVETTLFKRGYKVILCNAGQNKKKEHEYLRMLQANQVDGIIAGAHNLGIEEYKQLGLPIVSFDRKLAENVPIVSCDNYQGIKLAVRDLIQGGCKKIYFLGNKHKKGNPTDERLDAYLDEAKNYGFTPHIRSVAFSDSTNIKNMEVHNMLTNDQPDGVVCTDDLTAILVLQEAKKLGISIPSELKVIGFDGTQLMQTYHSELSTIAQPIEDIATLLVNLLLKRIAHPEQELKQKNYVLPVKLIKGETTA
ncbi:LacI family DNA-binding transcriptional regulator [Lactobacillus kefiranofaciens]|uniref:LacI family DNA-binding transcriptional regulator n=1 Tax=Lactobacillus kefiranofaciens TaxID=267818 RepID=A0AAX3UH53_9LACO|nr:LacI family DNA-binding transcriptional regulator [Lactobacillus kefiranofaciens]AEG39787.1 LacI family transcriptional regulator [Lactobacillus kefiranofaciens subsp. kefiranofaciens]KRL30275.1 LacI family transcriptional regulator [Lactobacillus kefiranofaciens subsp. kefirgranum DSM 10550 = JCM 8572]KRM22963.1 LacI family transcriptional regulator [Lactobacillus kefiranofaciens subsp. kefiranofaciens DSM 5016 = JCM 6985]MCP9330455.1 LacI family DNA-binding transcriptional regulator [Lacto